MNPPLDAFPSKGGRRFTVGAGEYLERFPGDILWSEPYPIFYEGNPAGKLFCSERYGRTCGNLPRWHASTRELYWRYAADAPTGIGFDVAAFDTAEAALASWARSADQILDWAEGKPVDGMYGRVQKGSSGCEGACGYEACLRCNEWPCICAAAFDAAESRRQDEDGK